MNFYTKSFLIGIILCISLPVFAGGPWTQQKKQGLLQIQAVLPVYRYTGLLMGTFINDVQGINRETFNSDYNIYFEYGITNKLTVLTTLPIKYISTGNLTDEQHFPDLLEAGSLFGLGNYNVGLKYKLIDKHVKVAVSVQTSWNTISKELDKGLATGFDAHSFGLLGHIGRSNEKHYGFLEFGFHKYTNGFSDVLEMNIEHGFQLNDHWNIALAFNARRPLENGSFRNENLEQTGFYPNNQGGAVISGKAAYEGKNGLGVNLALPLVPIKFKFVGFNGTVALGVYKKF